MTHELGTVFGELGIAQYLDAFIDQGFDSWDTILDITESDLDALGVKLGHRRKLQRRIANARGIAPGTSLVSPPLTSSSAAGEDGSKPDVPRTAESVLRLEPRTIGPIVISKRKYRRHPKPDENAPERPPSAYVLFSNKMREDLKGRNLSFTEIAKLVGENWQSLSPGEKEPYETDAQAAKDKYIVDLAEYKKTPEHKRYILYLQEFKAKYAHQSQEKDGSKRVKLSESAESSHGGGSVPATSNRTSRSGSGSESHLGGGSGVGDALLPAARQQSLGLERLDETVSTSDSQYSAATPASFHASVDEHTTSPTVTHASDRCFSERSDRSPPFGASNLEENKLPMAPGRRNSSKWSIDGRADQAVQQQGPPPSGQHQSLPPLSDMFDSRTTFGSGSGRPRSNEANGFPFGARSRHCDSPGPPPGLIGGEVGRPPTLTHEPSSTGSMSSNSSATFPRTPLDGPSSLPIHALLASSSSAKPMTSLYDGGQSAPLLFHGGPLGLGGQQQQHKPSPVQQYASNSPPMALINNTGYPTPNSQPPISSPHSHSHPHPHPHPHSHRSHSHSHSHSRSHSQSHSLPDSSPGYFSSAILPSARVMRQDGGGGPGGGSGSLDGMSALLKAGEIVDRRAR